MRNYNNERARQAGTATSDWDHLYNFIIRLLLERVTNYVKIDARRKEIITPLLKVIFSYRKGHSAAHLRLYLNQLKLRAENKTTHWKTRVIHPEVLQRNLIVCEDPKKVLGLQLADILTSAVYFSIDTENWINSKPHLLFGCTKLLQNQTIVGSAQTKVLLCFIRKLISWFLLSKPNYSTNLGTKST